MSKSTRSRKKQRQAKKKLRSTIESQPANKSISKQGKGVSNGDRTSDKRPRSRLVGLLLPGVLSAAIAIYIGFFVKNQFGLTQGIIWGVLAGISIWVAFYASFWFNRWLRRRE